MHEEQAENEVAQIVAEVQQHMHEARHGDAAHAEASPAEGTRHSTGLHPTTLHSTNLHSTLEPRLRALEERLHAVEAALKARRSVAASALSERTEARLPRMLSKGAETAPNTAGVDAALGSLSVEQRLAVKAGLLRAGLL